MEKDKKNNSIDLDDDSRLLGAFFAENTIEVADDVYLCGRRRDILGRYQELANALRACQKHAFEHRLKAGCRNKLCSIHRCNARDKHVSRLFLGRTKEINIPAYIVYQHICRNIYLCLFRKSGFSPL